MKKTIILNKERDVTLSPYLVTEDKKVTFLICPGGAYRSCDESEGKPVAKALNDLGYNVFILRYSVGKHFKWPYPLNDFDCAMEYLLSHADELHVDNAHIVAMGFSAGGHVVATAASIAKHRPFAAVLCYGLTAKETLAHCAPDTPDAADLVNLNTCPCFFATGRNDWIVPVFNTTRLLEAFQLNYVDYEAHIYGYAMHGFSVGKAAGATGKLFCSRIDNWVGDCLSWLDELLSGRYMSVKECAEYNDKYADCFSTRNSCKLLFDSIDATKIIKHKFPIQYGLYVLAKKEVGEFMNTVTLRNLYELTKVSESVLTKMDVALSTLIIKR